MFWLVRHKIFFANDSQHPDGWNYYWTIWPNVFLLRKDYICVCFRNISCETRTLSDCEDVRGSGVPAGWPTLSHNGGEPLFSLVSARSLQYGQHQSHGITKKEQNEIRL